MNLIAAFYAFVPLPDYEQRQAPLLALARENGVRGTILLAQEGVNGTIAGPREGVEQVLAFIRSFPGFAALEHKEATRNQIPFSRMKVRLKKEIVTLGQDVDVANDVGTYVSPEDWNALISDPDVLLVDVRNHYEVEIGTFKGAVDPETEAFRDLPDWLDKKAASSSKKKLAMFCTGGIRCEKSTAYAKRLGFDEVFHLKGGILNYLETVPEDHSKWSGACYVFDERVSVLHGLKEGEHVQCNACGRPVDGTGQDHPDFEEGVSCAKCRGEYSKDDRARFRQRHQQITSGGAHRAQSRHGHDAE